MHDVQLNCDMDIEAKCLQLFFILLQSIHCIFFAFIVNSNVISKERVKDRWQLKKELMYKQDFVAVSLWRSLLFDLEFVEEEIIIFSSSLDYLPNDGYVDESFPGQKEPKTIWSA